MLTITSNQEALIREDNGISPDILITAYEVNSKTPATKVKTITDSIVKPPTIDKRTEGYLLNTFKSGEVKLSAFYDVGSDVRDLIDIALTGEDVELTISFRYGTDDSYVEIFKGYIDGTTIDKSSLPSLDDDAIVNFIVKDYQYNLESISLRNIARPLYNATTDPTGLSILALLPNINKSDSNYLISGVSTLIEDVTAVSDNHPIGEFTLKFFFDDFSDNYYLQWGGGSIVNITTIGNGSELTLYAKDGELTGEYITVLIGIRSREYLEDKDREDTVVIFEDGGVNKVGLWYGLTRVSDLVDKINTIEPDVNASLVGSTSLDSVTVGVKQQKHLSPCELLEGIRYVPESIQIVNVDASDNIRVIAYRDTALYSLLISEDGDITVEGIKYSFGVTWVSGSEEVIHVSFIDIAKAKYYIFTYSQTYVNFITQLYSWDIDSSANLTNFFGRDLTDTAGGASVIFKDGCVGWSLARKSDEVYFSTVVRVGTDGNLLKVDLSTGTISNVILSPHISPNDASCESSYILGDEYCWMEGITNPLASGADPPAQQASNLYLYNIVANTYKLSRMKGNGFYRGVCINEASPTADLFYVAMLNGLDYSDGENKGAIDLDAEFETVTRVMSFDNGVTSITGRIQISSSDQRRVFSPFPGVDATTFTSELKVGDFIAIALGSTPDPILEYRRVSSIESDTSLYVELEFGGTIAGAGATLGKANYKVFGELTDLTATNFDSTYGATGIAGISFLDDSAIIRFTSKSAYEIVSSVRFSQLTGLELNYLYHSLLYKHIWSKIMLPYNTGADTKFLIYQDVNYNLEFLYEAPITPVIGFYRVQDKIIPYVLSASFESVRDAATFFRNLAASWLFIIAASGTEVKLTKRTYQTTAFAIDNDQVYSDKYSDSEGIVYDAVAVGGSIYGDKSSENKLTVSADVADDIKLAMAKSIYDFVSVLRSRIVRTTQLFYQIEQSDLVNLDGIDYFVLTNSIDLSSLTCEIEALSNE